MKNINEVSISEVISAIKKIYSVDDLEISYWVDEECRNHGISEIYMQMGDTIEDIIVETRKLVTSMGYASAEIRDSDYNVVYFIDNENETIIDLNDLDNECSL